MKKFVRFVILCFVISATAGLISGCEKELKTVVIKPDSKRYYYSYNKHGEATSACIIGSCFQSHGTSCAPGLTADDSTVVGYAHSYDSGTQPCPCWWYVNCAYRGYVGFDVSSLKPTGIVSAVLKWSPSTQRSAGDTATNVGNCIARMYRATEPWEKDKPTAGEEMSWAFSGEGAAPSSSEKDVSVIVRSWLNGTEPNYGFFFVGPNENVDGKDNNACLTTMTDLRLEAVIAVNK